MTSPNARPSEVPTWPELMGPVMNVLEPGETLHRKEIFERAARLAHLSEKALQERLNSGELNYEHRMSWVLTHLARANLVDKPSRGHYRLNAAGRQFHSEHPDGMTYSSANTYFKSYWKKEARSTATPALVTDVAEIDPLEKIDQGFEQLTTKTGEELLQRLRGSHPDFFEEAVVQVLLKMGYGGIEERGRRIGGTGDGGVDGVIDQDPLGLNQIYIQAKRYAETNSVGREALQAFVGALHVKGAPRGIFITTSTFTALAKEYASLVQPRPILIDGARLVALMIKYRVGVQVKQTYEVLAVDEDFFE
ncbi:restriction endonuclease [Kocuria rhizophila]|uniref:restriction endonuclease n=3 Tax=Kocuria TaxID=57493 RepID=UPI0007504224|nr:MULTISPECIES: restriction endonuclease [Kocuria]KUP27565.1 restriction endonuclease [Kocuria rhizophila]MDN3463454.1 restriction endonuclease [Kocuria sp. APC 4018]QTK31551.1 restriction endonuclease [Kocuria rhizophila]